MVDAIMIVSLRVRDGQNVEVIVTGQEGAVELVVPSDPTRPLLTDRQMRRRRKEQPWKQM